MTNSNSEIDPLLIQAAAGDQESWGLLLTRHKERMRRMVAFRLDQRLQGRVDPSDVLQEAYVEASAHLKDYMARPEIPFFLWLRGVVANKLRELHRHHLGTKARDAHREVSLYRGSLPDATSEALAAQLLGRGTRPSEAAVRAEVKVCLQAALNTMDELDREVLALRHFEQLSNAEAAQVLGIQVKAAGKRYLRALQRLRLILAQMPGGLARLEP